VATPDPADFDDSYWEGAEFVFNRLFVDPAALQAPPYASYYLEPEQQLMGKSMLKDQRGGIPSMNKQSTFQNMRRHPV
jgi:TorA maturation chaperone TorD